MKNEKYPKLLLSFNLCNFLNPRITLHSPFPKPHLINQSEILGTNQSLLQKAININNRSALKIFPVSCL